MCCNSSQFPVLYAVEGRCSSPLLFNNDEVHGGSSYGAGTIAGVDGMRTPSDLEKTVSSTAVSGVGDSGGRL